MTKLKRSRIWRRMRAKRIALGISTADLARMMGKQGVRINAQQIMAIEKGERRTIDYEVLAIARALGVTANWLVMGKNR